ncbi:MAG: hypothetical protein HQL06_03025 [Nitrospirae bacterium]|uniref:Magnetosome protein Man4 n=1 Tax=uncultured Nitrospirota bacterium TaxID=170969 RepID=A0A142BTX7_9BACT|nr:magnetosome protein Man4 [uncultured Nitrospirota bacterium]MBF0343180.1 hypothetical protein [Nitrospirota bacterium]
MVEMVESNIEQKVKAMKEGEKDALLYNLLVAAFKVKDITGSRKSVIGELKKTSEQVINDVVKIMESQRVRVERENEELKAQVKKLQDNIALYEQKLAKVIQEKEDKLMTLNAALEHTEIAASQAVKEKNELQETLRRLQENWERFISET